jgi:hypothetical protein
MVKMKSTKKYMTKIGQYTGISNACENVQKSAMSVARVDDSLGALGSAQLRRIVEKLLTRTAIQAAGGQRV